MPVPITEPYAVSTYVELDDPAIESIVFEVGTGNLIHAGLHDECVAMAQALNAAAAAE